MLALVGTEDPSITHILPYSHKYPTPCFPPDVGRNLPVVGVWLGLFKTRTQTEVQQVKRMAEMTHCV